MKIILKTTGFFLFICIALGITFSARAALRSMPLAEKVYLPITIKKYPPLQIAFNGDAGDNAFYTWHIFVVNDDGTGLQNLTYEPGSTYEDSYPVWSPNGDKIAFQSDRDGYDKIYVMNPDGSQVTRLVNNTSREGGHSWSPNGTQLSLASHQSGNQEVYTINVDGTNMVQITNFASDEIMYIETYWSPTGNQIALTTYHVLSIDEHWQEVYLVNADGSNLENITIGSQMEFLSWSPDGTKLLFRADQNIDDITYTNLYVMNLPSHEVVQLTVTGLVAGATWSPDSSQIVFSDRFQGTFIINPAGTNQTELSVMARRLKLLTNLHGRRMGL